MGHLSQIETHDWYMHRVFLHLWSSPQAQPPPGYATTYVNAPRPNERCLDFPPAEGYTMSSSYVDIDERAATLAKVANRTEMREDARRTKMPSA
jgi:hypothetical protein